LTRQDRRRDLSGKVCIVTGAGSGIGACLAHSLLAQGARTVLAGRRTDRLEAVARTSANPANAITVPTDISRLSDLQRLVEASINAFGTIDVLVNNAGTTYGGALLDVNADEVEYLMKVNLVAPIWLTQLVLPFLRQNGDGLIVNICSVGGLVPMPNQSFYCASKHGLNGFSRSLRRELLGTSIDVLSVYPGGIASEMLNEDVQRKMEEVGFKTIGVMPTERAAHLILDAMRNRKQTAVIAGRERWLVRLNRWAPWLLDARFQSLAPQMREILREANKWSRSRNRLGGHESQRLNVGSAEIPLP
jgi:short-subunit dehydrogenase